MFSPFSQKTQGSSQAFNPFATRQTGEGASFGPDGAGGSNALNNNKRKPGFATDSDTERKSKHSNPFKGKDGSLSDSGQQWKKRGENADKKAADLNKNTKKPRSDAKGLRPPKTNDRGNRAQPTTSAEEDNTSRPSSSSSASSVDETSEAASMRSADPFAKKVYDRLRKDGISPPSWPSQPGDPANKAEMAKFRDKYEEYRQKVRASLTKAALIDDPDKRRTLQNAIDFRGICEDMCPEYEKITRITEADVPQHEKDTRTGFAKTSRMVKKLARSAAGQEAPLPMDVRSTAALRRTMDYLIDDLLQDDENLPTLHGFLWDRTRAIRRDFTFLSSPTADDLKTQTYVLENIARFHVTALHLLSQPGKAGEDFVEQQELEQLGKALLSLRDLYDDCNAQGITCENEAEFRAFYLLFHAHDPNTIEMLQRQWKPQFWRDSDDIRTAVSLVEALQNTDDFHGPLRAAPSLAASNAFHSFFRMVEDPSVSYTMACFAECHFPQLRRSILRAVKRALARPKDPSNDLTAASLNKFLRFDTVEQAIDFAKLHGIDVVPDPQAPMDVAQQRLILNNREPLLHPRLTHQFSQSLVEKKRGSRPLPDVIHTTIHEDSTSSSQSGPGSFLQNEGSLFVQDPAPIQPQMTATQPSTAFPAFNQIACGPGTNLATASQGSENKKAVEPPVQLQPGTLQPSSAGFPEFKSPTTTHFGDNALSTTPTSTPPALFSKPTLPPAPFPAPASPPRDPLGDLTKWFVNGDKGLMNEFEAFMVESIVRDLFDKFQRDEEERLRREKEERDNAEAKRFRVYNLSLKYFYRWKKNAREKRLRQLRRSGREQFRAFREAQRAAQIREEQETAQRIATQKAELAALNRPDELAAVIRNNQRNKRKAEEALLASGVLSGVTNERRAVSAIFRNEYRRLSPTPSMNGSQGMRSRSGSVAGSAMSIEGGSKTRALREKLMGERPGRFQRALPSISGGSSPPEKSRTSKVSERWRLKAMGIVQMPDGTALPESMADEIRRGFKKDTSSRASSLIRRASITSAASVRPQSPLAFKSLGDRNFSDNSLTMNHKRKRSMEIDDEIAKESIVEADPHKRVMSDADILLQELRAMRQEMEEGTTWFKSQNGRLQSEIMSRGGTPMDESGI
ncbi:hypothetical protein ACHAO4_009411 [Trichoderma viride]